MRKLRDETQDTIAAIATPIGESAIGVIRMSGKRALEIADRIFFSKRDKKPSKMESFRASHGYVTDPETGRRLDEVLLLILRAPRTYTCEDMVEIFGHGGTVSLREILECLLRQGARLARPGEFTERAFLNGRIDLSQAEAVLDVIRSKTDASLRSAMDQLQGELSKKIREFQEILLNVLCHVEGGIDFPDEDIEILNEGQILEKLKRLIRELELLLQNASAGIVFREGLTTVIAGRPNVGKSSILNALLRHNRAIVTPIAGTTRDAIEEVANIRGIPVRLVDTAGIQETGCIIEAEGISRSRFYLSRAELVLFVLDGSEPTAPADWALFKEIQGKKVIFVVNKADLPQKLKEEDVSSVRNGHPLVKVSATTGDGIAQLESAIHQSVWEGRVQLSEGTLITNIRHREALARSLKALEQAQERLESSAPPEIVAVDLREALEGFGEVVGEVFTEDLLDKIFSQFCIGK